MLLSMKFFIVLLFDNILVEGIIGQKNTVFGLEQPILVWRPSPSGTNSGIHRVTFNSKRYPHYLEPFRR